MVQCGSPIQNFIQILSLFPQTNPSDGLYFAFISYAGLKRRNSKSRNTKVLSCRGPVNMRAVVTRLVQAGKLGRGLYATLLHHPIKQALNFVYRPLRGQSFPFPLLPLVFYIDKGTSLLTIVTTTLSPTFSFTFSPTHDVALEGREVRSGAESPSERQVVY